MGILNVTADSFSDGGQFLSTDHAVEKIFRLIEVGADCIDVGGESSKPGALHVPAAIELERIIPVIEQVRKHSDICLSVDTYKPEVMKAAIHSGANVINDIYALQHEGALTMAAQLRVPVCLMHMQGTPQTMQTNPQYPNGLIAQIVLFFKERLAACDEAGVLRPQIILDPGFGFGKLVQDNLQLIHQLDVFSQWHLPVLLGVSRKSTLGAVLNKDVGERLIGGIALTVYAALKGVSIIRTHDVDETNQALKMIDAIYNAGEDIAH